MNKIAIKRSVYDNIIRLFDCKKEDGGIIGIKDGIISAFFFNPGNEMDGYHIDVQKFSRVVEEWDKEDIEFVGFIHSHPFGEYEPSLKDFAYLRKFLKANPDLKSLHFPVVFKKSEKVEISYFIFEENEFKPIEFEIFN